MWPLHRSSQPQQHDVSPPDDERIADVLAEIAQLRLFLATDMSLAAGATDVEAYDIAGDVVDAGRQELSSFEARILARLHDEPAELLDSAADTHPAEPSRGVMSRVLSSRALPAAPVLAAAAAAVAVAMGVVTVPSSGTDSPSTVRTHAVAASWDYFHEIATGGSSADAVIAAGQRLHDSLVSLIDAAGTDPAKGRQALEMLAKERELLLSDAPPGAQVVLAQAAALVAQLQEKLPHLPAIALPTEQPRPENDQHHEFKPSQQPSPNAQPAAAPADAQAQTAPSASPSPSPSPSVSPSASQPSPDTSPPDDWGPLQPPRNFGN